MSDTIEMILGICALLAMFALTRRVHAWRIRRAYDVVVRDLRARGAVDEATAVKLPYAKKVMLNVGFRDFRPKVVEFMVQTGILGVTQDGRHYLLKDVRDLETRAKG
ncbi:MAG: hypothetical protein JRJ35_12690 [Deltaproteobacteria bacterium]|nr:hypothetical protein [Deltaproteobacteria bacterium]